MLHTLRMIIVLMALIELPSVAVAGEDTARWDIWSQIGYAIAAAKACPKVKVSPDGMKALSDSLDAEDQAEVFTNTGAIDMETENADKTFALVGDRACDIALDHMKKSKFKLLEPVSP